MGSISAARSSSIDLRINASSRSRCEKGRKVELLRGVAGDRDFLRAGRGEELGEQWCSARFSEGELWDEKDGVEQLVEVSEAGSLL